jgi:hypothetical protein
MEADQHHKEQQHADQIRYGLGGKRGGQGFFAEVLGKSAEQLQQSPVVEDQQRTGQHRRQPSYPDEIRQRHEDSFLTRLPTQHYFPSKTD